MSSLQAQLSSLASQPGARGHALRPAASLFFDRATAKGQDMHQVYEIGVNGFLELQRLEERVCQYSESLFSAPSSHLDRLVESAEKNAQLDRLVSGFLALASPYLLLSCTQKALEYLLRRFEVHRHSVLDLVSCALPFHSTDLFVRLLALTPVQDSLFGFLGGHPKRVPRSAIVDQCLRQPTLVEFICDAAKRAVDANILNRPLTSFYMMVGVDCVRRAHSGNREGLTRALAPFLVHGIQSQQKGYRAASLMILGQLLATTTLSEKLLLVIVPLLTPRDHNDDATLQALVLLTQTQPLQELPSAVVLAFVKDARRMDALKQLAQSTDVSPLASLVLRGFVTQLAEDPAFFSHWADVRANLPLCAPTVASVSADVFRTFSGQRADPNVARVLQQLDALDAHALGKGLCEVLDANADPVARQSLSALLESSFGGGSRHSIVDERMPLFRAITHTSEAVRLLAFQRLTTDVTAALKRKDKNAASRSVVAFGRESVLAGLFDSSAPVVECALRMPWLHKVVPPAELFPLLERCVEEPRSRVAFELALRVLFSEPVASCPVIDVSRVLLKHMVQVEGHSNSFQVAHSVLAAVPKKSSHALLRCVGDARDSSSTQQMFQALSKALKKQPALWDSVERHAHPCVALLLALPVAHLQESLVQLLCSPSTPAPEGAGDEWSWGAPTLDGRLVAHVFRRVFKERSSTHAALMRPLFTRLAQLEASAAPLLQFFVHSVLVSRGNAARFCMDVWSDASEPPVAHIRALNVGASLLRDGPCGLTCSTWISSLFLPLFSSDASERASATHCCSPLKKYGKRAAESNAFLRALAVAISDRRRELRDNAANLPHVINDVFRALSPAERPDALRWAAAEAAASKGQGATVLRAFSLVDDAERGQHMLPLLRDSLRDAAQVESARLLVAQYSRPLTATGLLAPPQFDNLLLAFTLPKVAQREALAALTPTLWEKLPATSRKRIFSTLCDLVLTGSPSVKEGARKAAALLLPSAEDTRDQLSLGQLLQEPKQSSKRRKKKGTPSAPATRDDTSVALTRIGVALDLIRSCEHNWRESAQHVPTMFALLREIVDHLQSTQHSNAPLEHIMQMVLSFLSSSLSHCMVERRASDTSSKRRRKDELRVFDAESVSVLVACMSQCHSANNRADVLVLLHTLSEYDGSLVLDNLGSILTSMGMSGVFADDALSIWTLRRFLSQVLPGVAKSQAERVISLVRDAFDNIPAHRRLALFETLLRSVQPQYRGRVILSVLGEQNAERSAFCLELCALVGCELTASVLLEVVMSAEPGELDGALHFAASVLGDASFLEPLLVVEAEVHTRVEATLMRLFTLILQLTEATLCPGAYEALDTLTELFSIPVFLQCLHSVILHSDKDVRHRALRMFNEKTAAHRKYLSDDEVVSFLAFVEPLSETFRDEHCSPDMRRTALLSLEVLARHFADAGPASEVLVDALPVVRALLESSGVTRPVSSAAILCMGTMCANLGPRVVVHLRGVVDTLLAGVDASLGDEEALFDCVNALAAVVKGQSAFVSPQVEVILERVLAPALLRLPALAERARVITNTLVADVAVRLLFPVLVGLFRRALEKARADAGFVLMATALLQMLTPMVRALKPSDVNAHVESIGAFLVEVLGTRSSLQGMSSDNVEALEHEGILALGELVLQLNEEQFRPLFSSLTQWAFASVGDAHDEASEGALDADAAEGDARLVPFFACLAHLLTQLRSILVDLSFGHVADQLPAILSRGSALHPKLLENVCTALRLYFFYNTEQSIEATRYAALMDPLVALLKSAANLKQQATVRDSLVPCLVEMATSMRNGALLRSFNSQVLFVTREENAGVRLACLAVLEGCMLKMSEDFKMLAPETLSFLAELLEDDDSRVEQAAQALMRKLGA